MSRSRPRVVAACSSKIAAGVVYGNSVGTSRPQARLEAVRERDRDRPIGARFAGRREGRAHARDAALGIGDRAFLLAPRRRGQLQIGVRRGLRVRVALPAARRAPRARDPRAPWPGRAATAPDSCTRSRPSSRCPPRARRTTRPRSAPAARARRRTPHSAATSARCAGSARSRCADSRLARPPTSRPPIAFGCPVSENGPAPGLPICPVARWRLIERRVLRGARRRLIEPLAVQRQRGTGRRTSAPPSRGRPRGCRTSARRAAACTRARSPSARRSPACARRRSRDRRRSSHSMRCSMPWNNATSVPGSMARCRSASRRRRRAARIDDDRS